MKINISKLQAFCFLIAQVVLCEIGRAQDFSQVIAKADTVNFSIQKSNDWQLLNSYVEFNETKDSVVLELIILNDKKNIDWKSEQYIGRVKHQKFFSSVDRVATSYLLNDEYSLKVKPDGKCYISLEKGNPPAGVSVVIPLSIRYRL